MKKTNPEFVIYTGPMFGGKTSRMLAALDRATYQSKKIAAFKPKMDWRYSASDITTHTGHKIPATCVSSAEEIIDMSIDADIVAIDEAFMIEGSAAACIKLFKLGKSVYISSLQLSAQGIPFTEISEMFPWATKIEICPAVCPITGLDAYYTVAKVAGLKEIEVGGAETYEPRCHAQTPFIHLGD
jgi:thymidine kinase